MLVIPGEFPPEAVPEWVPIVDEANARTIRRAMRRWKVTIESSQDVRGPGTVVFGALSGGRLRMGENAVREGFDRSIRIREIRVDGRTVQEAIPGQSVALAFGTVPVDLFRRDGTLRPGRSTAEVQTTKKEAPNKESKEAILDAVGDRSGGPGHERRSARRSTRRPSRSGTMRSRRL